MLTHTRFHKEKDLHTNPSVILGGIRIWIQMWFVQDLDPDPNLALRLNWYHIIWSLVLIRIGFGFKYLYGSGSRGQHFRDISWYEQSDGSVKCVAIYNRGLFQEWIASLIKKIEDMKKMSTFGYANNIYSMLKLKTNFISDTTITQEYILTCGHKTKQLIQ